MKRPIINLLMGWLFLITAQATAQPTFSVTPATITANPGDNITVNIQATNFTNIISFQYSMNWPASVLKFVSPVGNISSQLPGFSAANFGTTGANNGQLSVSWFDPNVQGVTLPSGTALYSLTFQVLTASPATISFTGTPTPVEIVLANGNQVTPVLQSATVNPGGGGGGGGGGNVNGFAVIASDESVPSGTPFCVDVTVNDFDNIVSMQYTMEYDKNKFQYTGVQGFNLSGLSAANFGPNQNLGRISFSWFDPNVSGITLADGATIYQVCFNATGANNCGSTTEFKFTGSQTPIEVTNTTGTVNFQGIPGDLEICGSPGGGGGGGGGTSLTFIGEEATSPNGSQVCLDVSVTNFNCIVSAQYSLHWNQSILQYTGVQGFGLPDLTASNFGAGAVNAGTLNFSWFDQTTAGVTLPNNTVIFEVCFNVVGANGQSSPFTFDGTPTVVEVTNCNGQQIQPVFDFGSVTVGNNCSGPVAISSNIVTNVPCFGQTNGSIDITVTGGSQQKTYVWKNAGGTTVGTAEDLTGVGPGTYSVTVTSCGGQVSTTGTYTVTQPSSALTLNQQVTNVACFGEVNGSINITVTGGTATGTGCSGYTYIWSNGPTTQDLFNIAGGNYAVTVTDCRGCQVTGSYTVNSPSALLTVQATAIATKCFGTNGGSVVVTNTTGGQGPYQYSLNTGAFQSGTTFSNLFAGTYTVNVRDALNCLKTTSVTVGSPNDITINTTGTDATSGNCNGAIATTVSGGTPGGGAPGYTFSWSGPSGPLAATTANLTNLCSGTYCVTVTDFNNCTKTKCQLVSEPLSVVLGTKKDACVNICDGAVNLNVIGGVPPLTYSWSNGAMTKDISGLCPGSYSVTVTSTGNNVTQVFTTNIQQASSAPSIVNAVVFDPNSSILCNGSVSIFQAAGGLGQPYSYQWSNGQSGNMATGLCDEVDYTVTITDAQGCTGTSTYTPDFNPILLAPVFAPQPSCQNIANGALNIQLIGGIAPYTVTVTGPSGVFTQNNLLSGVAIFPNLAAGDYTVKVTDGAVGPDLQELTTTQTVPTANLTIDPLIVIPATSSSSGSINITPGGGALPYGYTWSNGSFAQDQTGLAPNTYELTLNDGNGCYQVFDVEVGLFEAELLSQNLPVCPDQTGSLTATGTGSLNTPFSYEWRNAAGQVVSQTAELNNQPVGSYTLRITDAQGIVITQVFSITSVSNLQGVATATSDFNGFNIRCFNGAGGAATVSASNGVEPYSYEWSTGAAIQNIGGLTAGTYTVTTTDAEGCKFINTLQITQPSQLTLVPSGSLGSCTENSGIATVFVSGGAPGYSYLWNDAQNQRTATAILLPGGEYNVTVMDANQCTATAEVVIPDPEPLRIIGLSEPDNGGPSGKAIVVVEGGTWPYEFEWSGFPETDSVLTELLPGRYLVKVTDFFGCEALGVITVGDITQCTEVLTVITPEGDGFNEEFLIGCLSRYSDNRLEIYNRWGQLVYEADNYNDGDLWRGTDRRGADVPDGVYFYVFEYLDPVTNQRLVRKGNVTVLRN